jgi:hypothetical protein
MEAGGGYLAEGRDKPCDVIQLEEEVQRRVADRDAALKAD